MALRLAVGLLSAAILGYEILLLRYFSIAYWHHFAFMIISLALLGFAASGSLIALTRDWLAARLVPAFTASALLFAAGSLAAIAVVRAIPFNPLELTWDRDQFFLLALAYIVLALPFLGGGMAIGLALSCRRDDLHRIYRYDLVGAGLGAVAVIVALEGLPLVGAFRAVALAGAAAALIAAAGARRWRMAAPAAALLALASLLAPAPWLAPAPSPYKELSGALRIKGATIAAVREGPLGRVTAVTNDEVPFRHAPGLSLGAPAGPAPQIALFTDGDGLTPITRADGDGAALAYLDHLPMALPYRLLERPRVLVLGAGGGSGVLLARRHGARAIVAVELNPDIVELVRGPFAAFAGHLYDAPDVTVHVAEARHFAATTPERFDLIEVSLLDSFTAASAGVHALNESGLYTVEALAAYVGRLAPGGILAITRWLKVPPRDGLKLFATAAEALRRHGVDRPGRHLALVRSWNTVTLLVAAAPLARDAGAAIRRFAAARGFDIGYLPDMAAAEANRFNRLSRPYYHEGARALLGGEAARFVAAYKFDLRPATDDRPYFFHFFKWRLLPELLAAPGGAGLALVEMGTLLLIAALAQAAGAAALLVLLPLAAARRALGRASAAARLRALVYFAAVGLAFLSVEMALIQRFSHFLGHPIYAVTVVLAAMLVFAGIGSGLARRFERSSRRRAPTSVAAAAVAVLIAAYLGLLPAVLDAAVAAADAVRIAVAVALIAPLAVAMGFPFPLGLRALAAAELQSLIPWAWGINGCASVLSAIGATLLGIHFGFGAVLALAALLYLAAALAPPPSRPFARA